MTAWLSTLFATAALAYLSLMIIKVLLACRIIRRQRRFHGEREAANNAAAVDPLIRLSSVTVLQPILSGDPLLARQLLTTRKHLPVEVGIIWLVDDSDLEGRTITEQLLPKCQNVIIQFCPTAANDVNPKSFKLQLALHQIETEYFAVIDDDTIVHTTSLLAALDHLERNDLYTGLPQYQASADASSRLLAHFVNNNAVLTYLPLLNFSQPVSINGMFYVLRSDAWRSIGGFAPILNQLCDDYAVYRHAVSNGWRVVQGISPQQVQTSVRGPRHYFSVMHRWMLFAILLTRDQPLGLQVALTILLGLPPLLLWLTIIASLSHAYGLIFLAITVGLRHGMLAAIHRFAFGTESKLQVGYSLLAELLQPIHLLHAMCFRTIRWRSRLIRVLANNRFQIHEEAVS